MQINFDEMILSDTCYVSFIYSLNQDEIIAIDQQHNLTSFDPFLKSSTAT